MIVLNKETKKEETLKLYKLGIEDIEAIMRLQKEVIDGLEDKSLFAASEQEEFEACINSMGEIWGYMNENDQLIAMGVYMRCGKDLHNYGYDIDLEEEELLNVGQIESTIVDKAYRGNKLQRRLCEKLEEVAIKHDTLIVMATAAPHNPYSVNTFVDMGYEIVKEKLKYGGLRRYILKKELFSEYK